MADTLNQRWAATIVASLVSSGVRHVVIAPGSRSTPLALACADRSDLTCWSSLDERSAAFLALGLSKSEETPAAVICTSGTAGAHFLPALLEAREGAVPLIAITADRPSELHGFGAPQTIDQRSLFGAAVRHAVSLPEPFDDGLAHVAASVMKLVSMSRAPTRGGVHLNVPFREPLAHPDGGVGPVLTVAAPRFESKSGLPDLTSVRRALETARRGVIVIGPRERDDGVGAALHRLGARLGFPVFAEAASNARFGFADAVWSYDAMLRSSAFTERLAPDVILRFGGGLTLKTLQAWVDGSRARTFAFLDDGQPFDPNHRVEAFFTGDVLAMIEALTPPEPRGGELRANVEAAQRRVEKVVSDRTALDEMDIARLVSAALPNGANLVLSSSMPIRDVDSYASATRSTVRVFSNRGVNGIDGVVSTAAGISLGSKRPTALLIGDVAALHDLSGWLLARSTQTSLTAIVVNNDGGGIFEFLPVAERTAHFERFFGTPHGVDFSHVAALAQANLIRPTTRDALVEAVRSSFDRPGLHLVEVRTTRKENVRAHRQLNAALVAAVEAAS